MNARFTIPLLASLAVVACDDNPKIQALGSLEITTSAPTVEKELVTSDGWTIRYDRFLVHVTAVSVAGADGVLAASATPAIVDLVTPGPKSLLSAPLRTARTWEDVSFQIGPSSSDTEITLVEPVKELERDMMVGGGFALHVEGRATRADVVKTFKWGFSTDTLYNECAENGARGLFVPPNGATRADITLTGDVLFADDLAGGVLRADAITAADLNNDGVVGLDELQQTSLDTARAAGASYATGDRTDISDLGAFIAALTPRIVSRWRAAGTCVAEPAAK